jgi:hypothetical protein
MRTPRRFTRPSWQLLDAAEQALDAEKIFRRIPPGVFGDERRVAAAELDFQRLRPGEKRGQVQRLDDGAEPDQKFVLFFHAVIRG